MPSPAEVQTFPSTSTRKPSETPGSMTRKTRGALEPPPVDDVEGEDVVVAALDPRDRRVRHVHRPLVGRERQAIRVDEIATRDRQLARGAVQAVDEAALQLGIGLVALGIVEDPVRRVGEPDRAIGGDDDVVGRVEPRATRTGPPPSSASHRARSARSGVARARRRGPCRRGRACGRWRSRTAGRGRCRHRRPTSGGLRCFGRRSTGPRPRRGRRRVPPPRARRRRGA